MWCVQPAKPQISLNICTVWSEPLLVAWKLHPAVALICINQCRARGIRMVFCYSTFLWIGRMPTVTARSQYLTSIHFQYVLSSATTSANILFCQIFKHLGEGSWYWQNIFYFNLILLLYQANFSLNSAIIYTNMDLRFSVFHCILIDSNYCILAMYQFPIATSRTVLGFNTVSPAFSISIFR